ncbi:MAG: PASTA domain-containing protein [Haloechinothrix sp.]
MSTPWQIASGAERLILNERRTGEATFTISNPGPVDDRAVLDIACSDNAQRSWFTVGDPQRLVPHGGSVTFTVAVAPGDKATTGDYWFAGRVYSADSAPEESAVLSNRVTFVIAGAEPKPKPIWIWLVPLIVLALAVIGVVLFLVLRPDDPGTVTVPEVRGQSVNVANQRINDAGLLIEVVFANNDTVAVGDVAEQDPAAGQEVVPRSEVTVTVSLGKLPAPEGTVTRPPITICQRFPEICRPPTLIPIPRPGIGQ